MKLLTYFVFTLLSIIIQFCVMDFIQGQVEMNEKPIAFQEMVKGGKKSLEIYKDHVGNDHALYYRLYRNRNYEDSQALPEPKYLNLSLDKFSTVTTESPITVFDVLYDENISTTDAAFTSETFFTSTQLDNITDITLFEKKNSTTTWPKTVTKTSSDKHTCYCNFLYKQCDINCCCDDDCSTTDKKLFNKCEMVNIIHHYKNQRAQQLTCDKSEHAGGFRNLFCIIRTNLPEKTLLLEEKIHEAEVNNVFLWQENSNIANSIKLTFDHQHVWLLKNRSLYYIDLPAFITNNYCSVRRPMIFLQNENIQCQVKLKDLEMFRIVKTFAESAVVSAVNISLNSTAVNCSSFYCTKWAMSYCDQNDCTIYSNSSYEAACAENWCNNVPLKLEYIFNIYGSKIVNATIHFYIQNISTILGVETYVTQEVTVKFLIGNTSLERIIKLSGNPGYISGSPVIASFSELNHTGNFFNSSVDRSHLSHADNIGGFCILSRFNKKNVEFGVNKRTKCKISFTPISTSNATAACIEIQSIINKMFCINRKVYISPYGNPENVKDDDWLPISLENDLVYGKLQPQNSKLQCLNLQTRVALIFTYVNLNSNMRTFENRLLSARVEGFRRNVTFGTDQPSTVITIDVNFVNVNKLTRPQIAEVPHLNLNLPKDFFFPFPSNKGHTNKGCSFCINCFFILVLLSK